MLYLFYTKLYHIPLVKVAYLIALNRLLAFYIYHGFECHSVTVTNNDSPPGQIDHMSPDARSTLHTVLSPLVPHEISWTFANYEKDVSFQDMKKKYQITDRVDVEDVDIRGHHKHVLRK